MPSVQTTIELPLPPERVYQYLSTRYEGTQYRNASTATKGYVPAVKCLESISNQKLVFSVPGRDPLLRFSVGGWVWSYQIEQPSPNHSKVTIEYEWSYFMSFIGVGTTRHQACNELVETVLALAALATCVA